MTLYSYDMPTCRCYSLLYVIFLLICQHFGHVIETLNIHELRIDLQEDLIYYRERI